MKNRGLVCVLAAGLLAVVLMSGCAGIPNQPVYDPMGENISFVLDPLGHVLFREKLYCQLPDCSDKYPRGYCPPGQVCNQPSQYQYNCPPGMVCTPQPLPKGYYTE